MPRYYFNLKYGGGVIRDDLGDELADDHLALERALETARALLRGAPEKIETWSNCVFEVTNSDGEAIWRMPVVDAVQVAGE